MTYDLKIEREGLVLRAKDLPALPTVLIKVTKLVGDPTSSTEQIAKVITQDQVLSAKVLKMVNSPIYGFPGRISSIQHALVLLGFNVIRGVILSTAVFEALSKPITGLWEHSLGAALAARILAEKSGCKEPDEYSVAGLLHDLGKVVAVVQLEGIQQEIEAIVSERDVTWREAEIEVLGLGHDKVNRWLAGHWNLPVSLKEAMAYHHNPLAAPHYPDYACVAHVADFMVRLWEHGSGGDVGVPYLDKRSLRKLRITGRDLLELVDVMRDRLAGITELRF